MMAFTHSRDSENKCLTATFVDINVVLRYQTQHPRKYVKTLYSNLLVVYVY